MLRCYYIGGDEFLEFENIITEKNNPGKDILTNIKSRVNISYRQYLDRFDELESKVSSDFELVESEERRHLQGCYSSLTSISRKRKALIYSEQPDVLKTFCPFCLLDKPRTLDHYIGQDEFPEYSFLAKNLIPCCYDCNQKKNTTWRRNDKRRFIHFYNDDFFGEQFLFADLILANNTPAFQFSLKQSPTLNDANFQIIQWHFEDLELLEQYGLRCNSLLSTEIKIMTQQIANGLSIQQLSEQLSISENNFANDFGVNYWHSVMYQCMSQNVNELLSIV